MIKIAVDGRPLQGELSGVGKYLLEMVLSLSRQLSECSIYIYSNTAISFDFASFRNITIVIDSRFKRVKPLIWSKFLLARLIKKDGCDFSLFGGSFCTMQKLPGKKISIVHDLNHILAKETMSRLHYLTHFLFFKKDIQKANFCIANSNGTAGNLKRVYNIIPDFILHPPIGNHYRVINNDEVKSVLKSLDIDYPYILTVATQEPRKNLDKTINVFLNLKKKKLLNGYKLLLVGGRGWKNQELQQLINENKDSIIQMGYTEEKYLPYLYNGAAVFVFPSKYEGYGMPVTEAILCGKKPIVSNIEELHEASNGYASFIDPENAEQYTTEILKAINNHEVIDPAVYSKLRNNFDIEFKNLVLQLSNVLLKC
ncbi:glycosyltransferase family 4 protein [Mucilaginibacter sp. R-33]|uniref:glycosyltransferase family 4 protein n=1 Tax=unclassified Mucilaginibacter TaxID=2617802 RepID=UPI003CEABE96